MKTRKAKKQTVRPRPAPATAPVDLGMLGLLELLTLLRPR